MSCADIFPINCVVDPGVHGRIEDDDSLQNETKRILRQLDDSTTLVNVFAVHNLVNKTNEKDYKDSDIKTEDLHLGWEKHGDGFHDWKPKSVVKMKHDLSPKFSTTILGEDEDFSKYTLLERIIGKVLRLPFFFPLEDTDIMLKDDEEAASLLKDLRLNEGNANPVSYNTDFNMITDESFSRIFFHGMGCVLLSKQEKVSDSELGPFVIDMPFQTLKVRPLFREYGARIHFSADQKVTGIYDYKHEKLVKPGEQGWGLAKTLAKVTALLLMTVREHLSWTHFLCSNNVTREMTLTLPPTHPIRRLLDVFTFRATEVNLSAFDTLVPERCFLHRSTGLEYSSHVEMFDMAFETCDIFEPFSQRTYNPALQKLVDEGKVPFITQGSEYYDIVRSFVNSWLDKAGDAATDKEATAFYEAVKATTKGQKYELPELSSQDAMANFLASMIFTATAYHEILGNLVDYVILPSRAGFRLTKKDPSKIDLQGFLNTAVIGAATSLKMPKLASKFSNFFGTGGAPDWEIGLWEKFQERLREQSKKVQQEDSNREVEFKYFDPLCFECSVSV